MKQILWLTLVGSPYNATDAWNYFSVHEAVGNLSEIQREAICLFYFECYSLQEASQFLDIPVGTLKRRLHDGRQPATIAPKSYQTLTK